MLIDLLDKDKNVITLVETTTPDSEMAYFQKMMPEITLWQKHVEPEQTAAEKLVTAQDSNVAILQELLKQTDYEAIKYAEGVTTAAQFANLKAAREAWRTAINSIQGATTVEEINAVTYSTTIPTVG